MSDKFRTLVFEISQNLSESDQETLVYIYRLPDSFKNVPPLRPLIELERRGVFSSSTPDSLADVLATIHRHDLVGLVRQYKPGSEVVRGVSGLADVKRHRSTTESALVQAQLMEKQLVEIRDSFCTYNKPLTTSTVEERNTSKTKIEEGLSQLQSSLQDYVMPVLSDMALAIGDNSSSKKPISAVKPKIQDLQKSNPQKVLPPLRTFLILLEKLKLSMQHNACNTTSAYVNARRKA